MVSLPPAPPRRNGPGVGEDTVPVVGPLRGRWGALQSRNPGEPPQRSPYLRLASLPRKRKCGRLFCCYGNKGQGAADHGRPGPIKQGGVSSTPCPPGLGLAQAGEKSASEIRSDAEEGRGEAVGGWSSLTHGRRTQSRKELRGAAGRTPRFTGKGTGNRTEVGKHSFRVRLPRREWRRSRVRSPGALCLFADSRVLSFHPMLN